MFEWQTDKIHFFDLSKRTDLCAYKKSHRRHDGER